MKINNTLKKNVLICLVQRRLNYKNPYEEQIIEKVLAFGKMVISHSCQQTFDIRSYR